MVFIERDFGTKSLFSIRYRVLRKMVLPELYKWSVCCWYTSQVI